MVKQEQIQNEANGTEYWRINFNIINSTDISNTEYLEIQDMIYNKLKNNGRPIQELRGYPKK